SQLLAVPRPPAPLHPFPTRRSSDLFCMTKDTISQIEIHTSERIVPPNTFIVDTPGIDAADDADRFMTESSLHLVDVLYYVMDYKDRKSTRLNSSHVSISYAVFCLKT